MTISSQFYNDTEGYWTGWQRHAQSVCFVLIACYYISVLYFLTMTAERAHNNLRMLVTPLRRMLVETQDVSRTKQLDILIKEVESAGPLSGNGYFDIGRGTLTSIVSISLTYFIILLQFRTG